MRFDRYFSNMSIHIEISFFFCFLLICCSLMFMLNKYYLSWRKRMQCAQRDEIQFVNHFILNCLFFVCKYFILFAFRAKSRQVIEALTSNKILPSNIRLCALICALLAKKDDLYFGTIWNGCINIELVRTHRSMWMVWDGGSRNK